MAELVFSVNGQSLSVKSNIEKIVENSILYLYYRIDYSNWRKELSENEKVVEKYPDGDFPLEVVPIFTFNGQEVKGSAARGFVPIEVIKSPGFTVHLVGTIADLTVDEDPEPIIITTYRTAVKVYPTGALDADNAGEIPTIRPTWVDNLEVAITSNYTEIEELKEKVDDFITVTEQSYETVENNIRETNTKLSDFVSDTKTSYEELNTTLSSISEDLQNFKKEVNINGTLKRIENLETTLSNLDLETKQSFIETNNKIDEINTKMVNDYVSKEYFWQEINNLKDDIEEISELVGGE